MMVDTDNFLELDYTLVARILASSELLITSEVEVYNAADRWLKYNIEERRKFAKDLLLKVRLHLLSDDTLKHLLSKPSSFTAIDECISIVELNLTSRTECFKEKSGTYYNHRYCNQKKFNILVCSGYHGIYQVLVKDVNQINGSNFNEVTAMLPMIKERQYSKAVCLKGEVYVFGGLDNNHNWVMSVEKYSPSTNTWNIVADMFDDRKHFRLCAFMDKILIIGSYKNLSVTSSCLQFNTKDNNWKEVSSMNEAREDAACAVFEGRIVVSGGYDNNDNKLNTVESYDVIADDWSSMPNMNDSKYWHSLVVVKRKLFAIGCGTDICEVFESSNKKFVSIKSPSTNYLCLNQVISIGSNIFAFQDNYSSIFCYDVDKDEWTKESCEITEQLDSYACVKVPCY